MRQLKANSASLIVNWETMYIFRRNLQLDCVYFTMEMQPSLNGKWNAKNDK